MHVVRQAVVTVKIARPARVVIVAAVAVQTTKKERNAVAALLLHVKHNRKTKKKRPKGRFSLVTDFPELVTLLVGR